LDLGIGGKRAFISGGSHGIGAAIALQLASEGADIAFYSRSNDRVESQVSLIKEHGVRVLPLIGDATDPRQVEHACESVLQQWGGVDILVNNVGGGGRWGTEDPITSDRDIWTEVYEKNVGAALTAIRYFVPGMRNAKWGRIVSVASTYGMTVGGRPWFNIAKTALIVLMKNLANNKGLARDGLTFNSVAPGPILIPDTGWDDLRINDPVAYGDSAEQLPLGCLGTSIEVASVVTLLCSRPASLVSGACVLADGGETASLFTS
jgi:3-oxoacyl-[acyl-carrier protein] reductase